MTVAVDKAIFTRWDAKSLDSTITGSLYHGIVPERTAMPYASYTNISDVPDVGTHTGRYSTKVVQFSVWDTTADLAGSHIELIKNSFVNSDKATADPLTSPVSDEIIKRIEPATNPIIINESEDVWQAMITLDIMYVEDRNLTPA